MSPTQPADLCSTKNHLNKTLSINCLIIAYHRPRNIGNHFSVCNLMFDVPARHDRPPPGNRDCCAASQIRICKALNPNCNEPSTNTSDQTQNITTTNNDTTTQNIKNP